MSLLVFIPTTATEIKEEKKDISTTFYTVEDEHGIHYYGPTGNNLSDKNCNKTDFNVIKTLTDYNKTKDDTIAQTSGNNSKLPQFVDNSQSIYFPEIGDQGGLGSCLFWAQIYYQYTYEYNRMMGIPTTKDNVFSPQWSYNVATAGNDMQCTTPVSLNFMKYQGSVPMSQVPYDENYLTTYPYEEVWRNSINYRIKEYYFLEDVGTFDKPITSPDDSDLTLIKTALCNGDILSFSTMMLGWTHVELTQNNNAPENDKYVGEQAVTSMDSFEGGHRMTIVGYNDNIWVDINKNSKVDKGEMGAFKIANSWGKEYGNDGFCWVAYDALNYTSCVNGVPENKDRDSIFTEVTKLEVMPYGTDTDLYLKYTLNTADRTHAVTSITAEKDGSVVKKHALSNMMYGDPIAYNGSTYASDATMIMSIQSIFPDVTSENFTEYTWTVEFEDMLSDKNTLTVKNAVIVDEVTGKNYTLENSFPFTLNGESKSMVYNESKLNHALVYYRGFYNPSISYKLDGESEWHNDIIIEPNTEQYGYTHKFIIDLETTDKATLYFTDENGNFDDNNGMYFTAQKGFNYYITENIAKPLSISMTNDLGDIAAAGRFGQFKTEASGGYEPYLYEYVITNLDTGEVTSEGYDTWFNKGIYFSGEGNYKIVVNLKDCAGTIVSDVNYVTFVHMPFEFTTFDAAGPNNSVLNGDDVTFTAITNYENIGIHYGVYNEYNFTIMRGDEVCHFETIPMKYDMTNAEYMTTTITTEWKPTKTGFYTAIISSTDCAGQYAEKYLYFTVYDCVIGDADGDGEVTVFDATFIQMYLTKLVDKNDLRIHTADTDNDNDITVNDATFIQRYIAKYPDNTFIGKITYPEN